MVEKPPKKINSEKRRDKSAQQNMNDVTSINLRTTKAL
jgi:hypothetical protein